MHILISGKSTLDYIPKRAILTVMSNTVTAVFAITPNWNQNEPPLIIQWVWWYFQAMEYHMAIK